MIEKYFTLSEDGKEKLRNAIAASKNTQIETDAGQYLNFTVQSALAGDAKAQYLMGNFNLKGYCNVLQPDFGEAIRFYQASAEQMHEESIIKLLELYLAGEIGSKEVEPILDRTFDSETNDEEVNHLMGKAFIKMGDYNTGFSCIKDAASHLNLNAIMTLADLYLKGNGNKEPSPRECISTLKSLLHYKNYAPAQFQLAEVLRDAEKKPNKEKILKLYKKAAQQGHRDSMQKVSECYLYGYGIKKNEKKAQKWSKKLSGLSKV